MRQDLEQLASGFVWRQCKAIVQAAGDALVLGGHSWAENLLFDLVEHFCEPRDPRSCLGRYYWTVVRPYFQAMVTDIREPLDVDHCPGVIDCSARDHGHERDLFSELLQCCFSRGQHPRVLRMGDDGADGPVDIGNEPRSVFL